MDRLWTPWRYSYITGARNAGRKGVPAALEGWDGADAQCVFCNLIRSVEWGIAQEGGRGESAEKAGFLIERLRHCFVCLNAFPYSSGHILLVPYRHVDSLTSLTPEETHELMDATQRMEAVLREVYRPDGINLGLNLGEAAGAGVANHLHFHMLPRWFGDTNFMTVTAETRILPETLETTWERLRKTLSQAGDSLAEHGTKSSGGSFPASR
jgi:ATP adenylyltransferase